MSGPARLSAAVFFSVMAAGFVLLAAWLRLWRLQTTPPGLWFDESLNGMETIWMLKDQAWPIFILEGQGREVLFYYLLALAVSGLGDTIYVLRLVPALLAVLSTALMYRWTLTLWRGERYARWIALVSTAGLAVSFWYLVMSRVSYRANTLLPVLLLTGYFFWCGWQTGKFRYYVLAGLGLGLCQYTYLAGRLTPGIFIVFYIVQCLASWQRERGRLKRAGWGLLLMLAVAGLVFAPMLLFFVNYPELFWERSGDVALNLAESDNGWGTAGGQLISAIRVFVDGGDPNWRHHLLSRPAFDLFSTIGFWLGLLAAIRFFYRPPYTFLLVMLGVMWLPALLTDPAFHTLRLSGLLPAYYTLMAVGWNAVVSWLPRLFLVRFTDRTKRLAVLIALLLFSGTTTWYDYFYRWAGHPEVYQAFDGPVVDLANYLVSAESGPDVIIPFYLYAHASMRYVLHHHFDEAVLLPGELASRLRQQAKISLLIPEYPGDDRLPPAFVWLVKDGAQRGVAYVSAVHRDMSLDELKGQPAPIPDKRGNIIAYQYQIEPQPMLGLFPQRLPHKTAAVMWAGNLRLSHYEFMPSTAKAGDTIRLDLTWQLLNYTGFKEKMFLQLVDSRGQPVGQQEQDPISRKMYRWRKEKVVFEQHSLPLDSGLAAGLYFVRLGFFDPDTGHRLAALTSSGQPLGDETIVGPFYVKDGVVDPTLPEHPLQVSLDDKFELLGYSMYPLEAEAATKVVLYWKVSTAVDRDYTVFVQWLDQQNKVLAQVDAQPLPNLYPTSRWQPGEIIADQFVLPAAKDQLSSSGKLVTGMYDLSTGVRLPVYDAQHQPLVDGLVYLID